MIEEIDLYADDNQDQLPKETFLIYGDTGTGKTTWSAGAPRPLFLADSSEGGWKSLRGLADDQLFEPEVDPMVWGVSDLPDMASALKRIPALVQSGRIATVVISSITYWANTYLAHLQANKPGIDTRQLYGQLAEHLRMIRTQFHNLGTTVIWEALADHPETGGEDGKISKPGRPSIPGKSADQFAAGVTFLFRSAIEDVRKDGAIVERKQKLFTQTTGGYISRGRLGKAATQLPNPLYGGYAGFLKARGFDVERLRRSMPRIPEKPSTSAKPASTATSNPKAASPPSAVTTPKK